MKKSILILLVVSLNFLGFSIKANSSIESELLTLVGDATNHFQNLVEKNDSLMEAGNSDDLNFIFYYTLGEEYNSEREELPSWIFNTSENSSFGPNTNWLRDDEDVMPLAQHYRDLLAHYNPLYSGEMGGYLEHYVVLFDVSESYLQNTFNDGIQNGLIDAPDIMLNTVPIDNSFVKTNLVSYSNALETFKSQFYASIDIPFCQTGAQRLLSIAYASYDVTLGESVTVNIEFDQHSNFDASGWTVLYNNHAIHEGFSIVDAQIDFWINAAHGVVPESLDCEDFLLTLSSSCAKDFHEDEICPLIQDNEHIKTAANLCTQYYNYVCEFSSSISNPDLFSLDVPFWSAYILSLVNDMVDQELGSPEENLIWIRDRYNSLSMEDKTTQSIRQFFSIFYNTSQPFPEVIIEEVQTDLKWIQIDYDNAGGLLDEVQNNLAPPYFPAALFYEGVWTRISNHAAALAGGPYSGSEKEAVFDLFKQHEEIFWEKILTSNGIPFYGVNSRVLAKNLNDFIYPLVEADEPKRVIWKVPSKYYTWGDPEGQGGSCTINKLDLRTKSVVHGANGSTVEYSILVTPNTCDNLPGEEMDPIPPVIISTNDILTEQGAIGLFDHIHLVRVVDAAYLEGGSQIVPSSTLVKTVGFYPAASIHYDGWEKNIDALNVALTVTGIYGAAVLYLNASTTAARMIAGILLGNEVAGLYVGSSSFQSDMVALFGSDKGQQVADIIQIVHFMITGFDAATGINDLLTKVTASKADFGVDLLQDAAAIDIELQSWNYSDGTRHVKKYAEDVKTRDPATYNGAYDDAVELFYGINDVALVRNSPKLRQFLLDAFQHGHFNTSLRLNQFDAVQLQKFIVDLDDPDFFLFMRNKAASLDEAGFIKYLDAYDKAFLNNDIVSKAIRTNDVALDYLVSHADDIPNDEAQNLITSMIGKEIEEILLSNEGTLLVVADKAPAAKSTKYVGSLGPNIDGGQKAYIYTKAYNGTAFDLSEGKLASDFKNYPDSFYPGHANLPPVSDPVAAFTVEINMTGGRTADFNQAIDKLIAADLLPVGTTYYGPGGLNEGPNGYVFHHLDDFSFDGTLTTKMQLVKKADHTQTVVHTGSVRQYEQYHNMASGSYGS